MRKALIAFSFVLVSGCVTGDIVGSKTSDGTYVLKTVNGASLPFTVSTSGNVKTEMLDETMNLYEGFTFADKIHRRITTGTTVTLDSIMDTGNFSPQNDAIYFRFNSNTSLTVLAKLSNNVMTFDAPGAVRVFKKQ
jgi:hypothetical protein